MSTPFPIIFTIDRTQYRAMVSLIQKTKTMERYSVSANGKPLVFETNRPVIEARALKHFPYTWKLVEGSVPYKNTTEEITAAIEAVLRGRL